MALFKSLRGKRENLPSTKTDGYAYFCTDDGTFWIDYKDENSVVQRKQINAKDAETLMGASISTILNSSDVEIPTSKAVLDALVGKVPDGGTTGQVLKKTETGTEWADAPQSTLPEDIVKYTTQSQVEDVASIDASTLEGHSSSYFATTDALTALTENVSTNSEDISTLRNDISSINVIPDKHAATLLPGSADLNTYNTIDKIGWYYTESTTSMSNVPSGVTAFGLDVGRNSDSGFYQKLMVSSSTENAVYYRNYASSTWTSWEKIIFDSKLPPSPATYTGTLLASGWSASGNYQVQTITITGLKSTYDSHPRIDAQLTGTDADADYVILEAWGKVNYANTGDNILTAMCLGDAPEANIPIFIDVME